VPDEIAEPFTLSETLLIELAALDPDAAAAPELLPIRNGQGRLIEENEKPRRRQIYGMAYARELSALCLSGGGIRSASFALGIIQGLADNGLLQKFNYLSTVSGGGYIGSWLSAWLYHSNNADQVLQQLRSRRADADSEPPAIDHLREYSSYLTPKVGLLSADTWAAVAIVFRNILLNWLILLPAIALPVVAIKLLAALTHTALSSRDWWAAGLVAGACLVLGSMSLGYKLFRLYSDELVTNAQEAQRRFLLWSLTPAIAAGACFTWLANQGRTPADALAAVIDAGWAPLPPSWRLMVVFALIIYAGALLGDFLKARSRPTHLGREDVLAWAAAVVVFASVVWLGARLYASYGTPQTATGELVLVILGIPWFLLATLLAQTTYLMLRSYSPRGDVEREWLGRASGWHFIAGLVWVVLSGLVLLGPKLYGIAPSAGQWMPALGAVSGAVTALLGKSSATPAQGAAGDRKGTASNVALALAGPLFAATLLILLSVLFDWIFLGHGQAVHNACFPLPTAQSMPACGEWRWIRLGIELLVVMLVAGFFVNVNRFSLHTLYRNRLIRAFLGGARAPDRWPDGFTGFDWDDNLRVASLWRAGPPTGPGWRPFHVINMTLNLASTSRLAWQQRKGESFTVTPKFCGSADLGYRKTGKFGDPGGGITLGTAMAISGAAVSPNMGYHSSPSIAFLLTLFNVRLGWWLGNPGAAGSFLPRWQRVLRQQVTHRDSPLAPYTQDAPWFAAWPLFAELFGLTTENSPYVYLSDGGHFENLGLYEMVRRRCRWIVVCDGAQDLGRGYEDLGNAARKIWLDLGARIRFPVSPLLEATRGTSPAELPYFALGTIEYLSDGDAGGTIPTGNILYIKPAVRGDEGAAEFIAYQRMHPGFPDQSTADQWFDEPQLEAYRTLGHHIVTSLVEACDTPPASFEQLFDQLAHLDPTTFTQRLREVDIELAAPRPPRGA
jgi:Patatin-like phospholipase